MFPWTAGRATLPCVAIEGDNREITTLEVFTNQDEIFVVVRLNIMLGYCALFIQRKDTFPLNT